jgi:hypothetical protein
LKNKRQRGKKGVILTNPMYDKLDTNNKNSLLDNDDSVFPPNHKAKIYNEVSSKEKLALLEELDEHENIEMSNLKRKDSKSSHSSSSTDSIVGHKTPKSALIVKAASPLTPPQSASLIPQEKSKTPLNSDLTPNLTNISKTPTNLKQSLSNLAQKLTGSSRNLENAQLLHSTNDVDDPVSNNPKNTRVYTPNTKDKTKQQLMREKHNSNSNIADSRRSLVMNRTNSASSNGLPPSGPSKRLSTMSTQSSCSTNLNKSIDFTPAVDGLDDLLADKTNYMNKSSSSINQSTQSINNSTSQLYMTAMQEQLAKQKQAKEAALRKTSLGSDFSSTELGINLNPSCSGSKNNKSQSSKANSVSSSNLANQTSIQNNNVMNKNDPKNVSSLTLASEKSCY